MACCWDACPAHVPAAGWVGAPFPPLNGMLRACSVGADLTSSPRPVAAHLAGWPIPHPAEVGASHPQTEHPPAGSAVLCCCVPGICVNPTEECCQLSCLSCMPAVGVCEQCLVACCTILVSRGARTARVLVMPAVGVYDACLPAAIFIVTLAPDGQPTSSQAGWQERRGFVTLYYPESCQPTCLLWEL